MHPDGYYFGTTLARRLDYFAFPRTGSHFLWTAFTGLFDLVFFPNAYVANPEARQRRDELNPHALYAMKLREDGVPFQPVYINAAPNGVHGGPVKSAHPAIILIRDPHATIYSWYHTAIDRWGATIDDVPAWIQQSYRDFASFYDETLALIAADPAAIHLVRYEELRRDPAAIASLVAFVGVRPKLSPEFVFEMTRFDRMTREGRRTFYRTGDNASWRGDEAWRRHLEAAAPADPSRFGYGDWR
jgi:hypothetical protein